MNRVLYQFPISHYCEKVRWAMDYKGLDYKLKNLLPGLHLRTTKKIAAKSYVPILIDDGEQIQNSHVILNYLDEKYPDKPLSPQDPTLFEKALEWEKYCDIEIGVHVRRFCYHYLLSEPKTVIPFFTQGGPWWSPLFFKLFFFKLEPIMRKVMSIDEAGANKSEIKIQQAIDTLYAEYEQREFLVGDQFGRADLTACALLAPLIMPQGYGLDWPEVMPAKLQAFVDKNDKKLERFRQLYSEFR
ncbi:MAG: glutathione S-transferase family protein [Oleispira antarctica]|uniref:Glutathione S-transferase n=1 Tax=Oleispira antarctica RB-8 TaxID=698738 RepID=R4YKT7_OLEAN|nr:glutathione S-transferase family protein [Oleispira antarctica]MBQ0791721.1 glutathione S-transferase family protein [Oleispira antarctica]CCK75241.1 Glutathione S-transferase [Oleispira antarctica RB-8]|tara:strand:- start:60 stop:788 length:729 start_codon:yes stop_codon:yes gene_type:complete